ncbi:MAG: hypothetical protein ABWW69_06135, partial [Pyrodictiaceae archaeon]
MVSRLEDIEVFLRSLGLDYERRENALLVQYPDEKYGRLGVVIMIFEEAGILRVSVPLDVEPLEEALSWFLQMNFESPSFKYSIDYEGFITVVYDLPMDCISKARDLRDAILYVIDGARKVLERTKI